ncbi:hypothetical protein AN218_23120 [Streptomyces nanshensis]|uniref:Uncharacterized protein n=1 Tax=Streptomyces nanshensis TaxID=518642 RepID=A0A1E7KZJ1_9ACTN|nr:hypothetical protein AN218_23120 [Streptomyces nanshensis]
MEADEQLETLIARLTEVFGLPVTEPVTVLGTEMDRFQVTPGRLDDAARRAFSEGQCHALAQAVSEVTGWPMAALIDADCADLYDKCGLDGLGADGVCICQINHLVAVRPEDGALIDIDGAHHPDMLREEMGSDLVPLTEELWEAITRCAAFRVPDMPVARTLVEPLLDSLPPIAGTRTGGASLALVA